MIRSEQKRANCVEIQDNLLSCVPATFWNTIKLSALLNIVSAARRDLCQSWSDQSVGDVLGCRWWACTEEQLQSIRLTHLQIPAQPQTHMFLAPSSPPPPGDALQGRIWLSLQKSVGKKDFLIVFFFKKKKKASKERGSAASESSFNGSCVM